MIIVHWTWISVIFAHQNYTDNIFIVTDSQEYIQGQLHFGRGHDKTEVESVQLGKLRYC